MYVTDNSWQVFAALQVAKSVTVQTTTITTIPTIEATSAAMASAAVTAIKFYFN